MLHEIMPTGQPLTALMFLLASFASPLTCLDIGETDDPVERRAREIWIGNCAGCHGMAGDGRGPRASALELSVPDFTNPCRRLSPEWIERVILSGGARFRGNPAMRPHHELAHEREVLEQLVAHIHSLRSKDPCREGSDPPRIDPDDI